MSANAPTTLMTTEEFLALPEDGTDRELIRGELRENGMTQRNRWHSRTMVRIASPLEVWLENQAEPRGEIVCGEAGFRLKRNPDTTVGIDVAYGSAAVVKATPKSSTFYEGTPVLAVEILSPSDRQERVEEKTELYFEAGVKVVWIVNTRLRTVLVLRPGEEPEMFNVRHELTGGDDLPGFRVPVAAIFGA